MCLCLLCVEGSNEVLGRITLPSQVHTQTFVFIYTNIIHTLLSLYTLNHRPPPLAVQIVGVLSPSEATGKTLELGQAAAIKRCLTATRPLERMGGWKG